MPKDNQIPASYYCSISGQIMIDPVFTADGYTYEREEIENWLKMHDTSPQTNEHLDHKNLTINRHTRSDILEFLKKHPELYEGGEVYLPKSWMAQCVMAIKRNQPQEVQRWLDKDRRLLTLKLEGDSTALHLACEFSSPELVDALLKTLKQRNQSIMPGAVGFKSVHLNVLLEKALNNGDHAQCELLLRLGAEVEQPEISNQNTLLHRMVIQGALESVSWLLEKKALLESRNREGNTPLLLSVIHNNTKLSEFLLKIKADPQVKNVEQQSPVLIALLNQNEPMLRLLVGAEKAALPILHLALELNDNEIIKALLKQRVGALEARDEQQRTPFYNAVERGNCEAAALLLTQGANPTVSCGAAQLSTLHIATERGDVEMLKYLLRTRAVALIDMQNAKGDTPLHLAVQAGNDSMIPLLLEAGAYPKIKNEQNQTPIELARTQQKPKLANLIVQTVRGLKQAKLKETDKLHQVVAEQASEIANLKTALQSQGQGFKSIQSEMQTQIEKLERLLQPSVLQQPSTPSSPTLIFAPPSPSISFHLPVVAPKVNPKEVEEFLRLVAEGEQDKAEAMLKSNPALALVPGDVTDLSKRTFNGITAFQYAVWALDWHMWTMIRKYLPPAEAQLQAQGFETGAWVRQHGVHANLNTLIQAYQTTTDLYNASKYDEGNTAWVRQVGGAQLLLPAHVINEYCHPTRSFYPLPNFKDAAALPRSRTIDEGEWFTAEYFGGKLGEKFAWVRCGGALGWGAADEMSELLVAFDHQAVRVLTSTRTAQREELIAELKPRIAQRKAA